MGTLFVSRVSPVRLVSAESSESVSPSVFSSASSFSSPTSDSGVKASPPLLLPPLLLRRRGQPRYATAPSSARSLCAATSSDVQRSSSRMAEATLAEIGPDAARASMAVRTAACAVTTERRNSASSTQPAVVTPSPLSLVTEAEAEAEQEAASAAAAQSLHVEVACPETLPLSRAMRLRLPDGREFDISVPEGISAGETFTVGPIPPA
mmetsp:Transcript_4979/g.15321  ORF Transcript_4979/g.15321 Transcript_4979/m.15321 type:complete len:208 (-) Transcript_4979:150-773(-)